MALVDIANNAGGRIGGFGDQISGEALVSASQLTADDDKVSQWINIKYPYVRQKAIKDFAAMKAPFIETVKYADLGDDLKSEDIAIVSITSVSTVVTVTTKTVHGRSTGDTVFLADIEGTNIGGSLITSLNGTTPTITVLTTTTFTLDSVTGVDSTWDHTANSGLVSYVPEMGPYTYAFNLPSDFFAIVRHCDETSLIEDNIYKVYPCKKILNRDGDGFLLLTNDLTNDSGDSAYLEYCIDQQTFSLFSDAFEEVLAVLLAYELCPILGRDLDTRQKLLAEYKAVTMPEAKTYNQSQVNSAAERKTNYLGGRSKSLPSI